ncbi:MAG TPA: DnaA/Hda family protein [Fimbriimonas sp.]|nr:DnaA/Hda family protein [Fimbriimonas sp.]
MNTDPIPSASLSSVVLPSHSTEFSSLAALPSNVDALEAALLFSNTHVPFVVISGPSGCGKTQLLDASRDFLKHHSDEDVEMMSASQFLKLQRRVDMRKVLILDDCHEVMQQPKQMLQFRMAMDRRVKSSRPTMLAVTKGVCRKWTSAIPAERKWRVEEISEPGLSERVSLVQHMARSEKLQLSDTFARIIALKLKGNARVVKGALHTLRLEKGIWLEPSEVLRGCGMLNPFFEDNSTWDLRHSIFRRTELFKEGMDADEVKAMSVYLMLKVAGLPEAAVAQYFGCPGSVCYQGRQEFAKKLAESAQLRHELLACVEATVEHLAR